jgi:hypothetical protein
MIKEITAGALEIMNDVSRLKVIQLWAGKLSNRSPTSTRFTIMSKSPKNAGSTTLQKICQYRQ